MSPGGEAGHSGSPAAWRGGEARPARPTRATAGSEVSPARDPTAPRAPGERTGPPPSSASHGDRCPFNPPKPVPRPPPTPSLCPPRSPGLPARASRPPPPPPTQPPPAAREDGKDEAQGRLPGARLRVKGAGRDSHTGPGVGEGGWTGVPGGHRAHPRPGRLPGAKQADAVQPSPHLISRRVHAAASGGQKKNQCSSVAAGRGRRSRSPAHHPRPPLGASRSPPGILPREPPYYRATKLRALPSPPQLSAFLRSPPSVPRSRLSPHLPRDLPPPRPLLPSVSAHGGWVGTMKKQPIGRKDSHLLPPPHLAPPTTGETQLKKKKSGRGGSDRRIDKSASSEGAGLGRPNRPPTPRPPPPRPLSRSGRLA